MYRSGKQSVGSLRGRYLFTSAAVATWLAAVVATLCTAGASDLPDPAALEKKVGSPPETVQVVEPHLSGPDRHTIVAYRGWPANAVLDYLLGAKWRQPGNEVEFRALDGYVSRIPAARFDAFPAYLVFASPDLPGFTIDNPMQNEQDIPLGPYYLVWDNIRYPSLLGGGASFWPYQVAEVLISDMGGPSLLPGELAKQYAREAALAQQHCLPCHTINGYGGDKWPLDLAKRAKDLTATEFELWVLNPNAVKPGTAMPPFAHWMPERQRGAMAGRLYRYLKALPIRIPPDADTNVP